MRLNFLQWRRAPRDGKLGDQQDTACTGERGTFRLWSAAGGLCVRSK